MTDLSRREFFAVSAAAGAAATGAVPTIGTRAPRQPTPVPRPSPDFDLAEATIADLQTAIAAGRHTARSLVERYLARIDEVDARGPALRCVIEVNPDAAAIAQARDEERRAGQVRGVLHGIPVLIKDNIATGDRMLTTAGSLALAARPAAGDATVARRLRDAGAVIVGKTNLSEWANFRSTRSTSGWSARGGQCRNPYALDRNPCGSSSGTGAAVAANLAAVGVGTETDGSIVCPSHMCGLVGFKPTLGLTSRAGIVPIAHSQDTAGPMCRTVTDAAILLGVLAGPDARDPATADAGARGVADYTRSLDPAGLKGARIGVARARFFGYSPAADRVVEEALDVMRREGAVLVDPADVPNVGEYDESEYTVLLYEFKADVERYLAEWAPDAGVRTLADLIAFNERHRDREMPHFGQEIFEAAVEKGPLTDRPYRDALAKNLRLSRTEGIDAVLRRHRLDALLAPTGSPAFPIDLVNGDHFLGASSTPAAVAGYPAITVPAGSVHGLPVGLTLFGAAWSEPVLLRLAYAFERVTAHRRPPRFLPTVQAG
jgi:amidase